MGAILDSACSPLLIAKDTKNPRLATIQSTSTQNPAIDVHFLSS